NTCAPCRGKALAIAPPSVPPPPWMRAVLFSRIRLSMGRSIVDGGNGRYLVDDRASRKSTGRLRSGGRGRRREAERAESAGVVRDGTHLDAADPGARDPGGDPDG